ncbi:hypothetical protein C8R44DRAFT_879981 [Mycena epipterygia]|nr:hypothetical protein C8R44DRAFT_879981 [Mycena epipterygia]
MSAAALLVTAATDALSRTFPSTDYPAPVVTALSKLLARPEGASSPNFQNCKTDGERLFRSFLHQNLREALPPHLHQLDIFLRLEDEITHNLGLGTGETCHGVPPSDFFLAVIASVACDNNDDRQGARFVASCIEGVMEALAVASTEGRPPPSEGTSRMVAVASHIGSSGDASSSSNIP